MSIVARKATRNVLRHRLQSLNAGDETSESESGLRTVDETPTIHPPYLPPPISTSDGQIRILRRLLSHSDASIASRFEKAAEFLDRRWNRATSRFSRHTTTRQSAEKRRVNWGGKNPGYPEHGKAEMAPVWSNENPTSTTGSRLKIGYTPDDWLWDEARQEAEEAFGKGYAYQRDSLGRRVHRL